MNELDVYLYGEKVARVTRKRGALRLDYLPEYLERDAAVPVSVLIDVTPGSAKAETVRRFLENLLPDNAKVRQRWAREAKLPDTEAFSLLSVYGADVAGALELYPAGTNPVAGGTLAVLDDKQIGDRIRAIHEDSSDWTGEQPHVHGFSLGGAQGKFALARHDDQWWEPSGAHPSTHIFKPGIDKYPGSDVTEHLTMRLAQRLGFDVPNTSIEFFDGEHVLVVERFDRVRHPDGRVVRVHQEDLAQATGTSPVQKYERDGGPGYRDLFAAFDKFLPFEQAQQAKRRFAELYVFSLLVAHNDGHAKNFSITHAPEGSFLSPFYDLNTSLPYQGASQVRAKDYRLFDSMRLSFSVGGKNKIGDLKLEQIEALARDAEMAEGDLNERLLDYALIAKDIMNDEIAKLPEVLQSIPAVELIPYGFFAQQQRVLDLFKT